MRKWTNLKKAFTAITVCVFAALLLSGCDGGASLGNAKSYKFKPVFHFQTCDDNVWCLDVNGVLYKKGVEEREWKLQPEYYGEVIGYIEHSWTIHVLGKDVMDGLKGGQAEKGGRDTTPVNRTPMKAGAEAESGAFFDVDTNKNMINPPESPKQQAGTNLAGKDPAAEIMGYLEAEEGRGTESEPSLEAMIEEAAQNERVMSAAEEDAAASRIMEELTGEKIDGDSYDGIMREQEVSETKLTMREKLLSKVENSKLKNAINEIYRPGATIGDGGLTDAVRHEISTGELVGGKSHIQKATERVTNLENIINKQNLNSRDLQVAKKLWVI